MGAYDGLFTGKVDPGFTADEVSVILSAVGTQYDVYKEMAADESNTAPQNEEHFARVAKELHERFAKMQDDLDLRACTNYPIDYDAGRYNIDEVDAKLDREGA